MAKQNTPATKATPKKKPGKIDRFLARPAAEREAFIASLDRPIPLSETRPLTPAQQASWDRATGRKPGRPKVGDGTKSVLVSVEKGLLKEADTYAKAKGLKRTQLVAIGLRMAMDAGATADTLK